LIEDGQGLARTIPEFSIYPVPESRSGLAIVNKMTWNFVTKKFGISVQPLRAIAPEGTRAGLTVLEDNKTPAKPLAGICNDAVSAQDA
jgi:hypothetical protein